MFHSLIDWEHLEPYIDAQTSKDAIIADILICNYPVDTNGNGGAFVLVIFDIKTLQVGFSGMYKMGAVRKYQICSRGH